MSKILRILLSGGGTGGHIYPAVAIAQEIKKRFPDAEILFIGAIGKMEMEKVPQAGFPIEGLEIAGFNRSNILANFKLPFKLFSSINKAKKIIKNFKPDAAIGTGGYASGPALFAAAQLGIPTFIQEQNAFPGITNKLLSKKAKAVFTAYPDLSSFFPNTQTVFTGNPIRQSIVTNKISASEARQKLGLDNKFTILSVGGSLGSRTLNNAWLEHAQTLLNKDLQIIWQTGKLEFKKIMDETEAYASRNLRIVEFINNMDMAYSAADMIVSRAGAIAISELAVVQKPILLVPFPFAAEDHQTKNALNLVEKGAAKMVKDCEIQDQFLPTLLEICENEQLRQNMSQQLGLFAKPNATETIVDHIINHLGIKA